MSKKLQFLWGLLRCCELATRKVSKSMGRTFFSLTCIDNNFRLQIWREPSVPSSHAKHTNIAGKKRGTDVSKEPSICCWSILKILNDLLCKHIIWAGHRPANYLAKNLLLMADALLHEFNCDSYFFVTCDMGDKRQGFVSRSNNEMKVFDTIKVTKNLEVFWWKELQGTQHRKIAAQGL